MKKFVSALAVLTLVFSASNLFAQDAPVAAAGLEEAAPVAAVEAVAEAAAPVEAVAETVAEAVAPVEAVAETVSPAEIVAETVAPAEVVAVAPAEAAPAPCAPVAAPSCQPACAPVKKCLQLRRRFAIRCCAPCAPCAPAAAPCDCKPADCVAGPNTVCVSSGYVPTCIPKVRCPNAHPCLSPATICLPCGSCNPCESLVAPSCKAPVAPCAPACN